MKALGQTPCPTAATGGLKAVGGAFDLGPPSKEKEDDAMKAEKAKARTRLYVAYGSNLNVRQMRMRCPGARAIGTSAIEGYELLYKGSMTGSYLTIERKKGCRVPVAIWEVTEEDERALDRYEGFPHFYYKAEKVLPVTRADTGEVERRRCFVYIMHEDRPLGIPAGFYVDTCLEGYDSFGFDPRYLAAAEKISEEAMKDERAKRHHGI